MEHHKKLAILVGGGSAPVNRVIGAATVRAALEGMDVIGVRDGFEGLMHGDIEHVMPLTIDMVSRIHFRGGSHIRDLARESNLQALYDRLCTALR